MDGAWTYSSDMPAGFEAAHMGARHVVATNWVAVGGVAQILAAIATVGLATITARMATRTREMASETKAQAHATKEEAKATRTLGDEAKFDRQLRWRPQLDLTVCWVDSNEFRFRVFNAGGGPAIACKVLARQPDDINRWGLWVAGDIAPNSSTDERGTEIRTSGSIYAAFEAPDAMADPKREPNVVVICADILGRRYRFPVVDVFDDEHKTNKREMWKPFPPEIYEGAAPDAPTWTGHPLLWSY